MNETVLLAVVAAMVGILTPVSAGWIAYKMAQLKQNGDLVIESNKLSSLKLERELASIKDIGNKTLTHVNDQFLIQLRLYMESMETISQVRNAPGDKEKAEAARRMFDEHDQKQKEAAALKSKAESAVGSQLVDAIGSVSHAIKSATASTAPSTKEPDPDKLTQAQVDQVIAEMEARKKV